jgi:hypothetical protein
VTEAKVTQHSQATGPGYLSISEQRREVEEEGLAKRHRLDGVVKVLALVQLHLGEDRKGAELWKMFIQTSSGQPLWEGAQM